MSEFEPVPDPDKDQSSIPFSFSDLTAEDAPSIISDFEMPNAKATRKRRWWESKPKSDKPKRAKADKPMPAMPRGGLKAQLQNFYTGAALMMLPFDPHCSRILMDNAAECAEAMDEWAKTDPAVRRFLLKLCTASAAGKVFYAHLPILMGMAMHHVPMLRERQEKMVGEFAEMMANGFKHPEEEGE